MIDGDHGGGPRLGQIAGGALGHVDEDPHRVALDHAVERRGTGGAARRDQVADVDAPLDDGAVIGCGHPLELLEGDQPIEIGLKEGNLRLRRRQLRLGALEAGLPVLPLLLGHDALRRIFPAQIRALGEVGLGLARPHIGLGNLELGAGRRELGVELGRVDRRQDLALMDSVADIDRPRGHVAADPGVERALVPGRGLARQRQAQGRRRILHGRDIDQRRRRGAGSRLGGEPVGRAGPRDLGKEIPRHANCGTGAQQADKDDGRNDRIGPLQHESDDRHEPDPPPCLIASIPEYSGWSRQEICTSGMLSRWLQVFHG